MSPVSFYGRKHMDFITLSNNIKMPKLGFGVFQTPDGKQTEDAVKWALEAGYRHIDTAMIYGNESSVGKAMEESGVSRKDIFLTTKLWNDDIRSGKTMQAFEDSLERLRTDYLDLYLIHWPADGFEKAWTELEKIYASGRVKAVGVSNFQPRHLEAIEKISTLRPAVNQIESNPYFDNQTVIDYCNERGISVTVWSPLGGTGGNILEDAVLLELSEKYKKSPAQIVIRWHLQRDVVVIPKSLHRDRIFANFDVFDFVLGKDDMDRISSLNRNVRSGADPDTFDF
jgi:diketogulonate reductase-like aldo/keto reductase